MDSQPLNPKLYNALRHKLGEVRVANQGERQITHFVPRLFKKGEYNEEVIHPGEYYCVNCPHCGDTRKRLWINHRWNTKTPEGRTYGKNLAICYNEACDLSQLDVMLNTLIGDPPIIKRPVGSALERPVLFAEVQLPGKCVPLTDLPSTHPALDYLRSRKFDPVELFKDWNLHYCVEHEHSFVRARIIIPVYWEGKLVGWQARAVGSAEVKYYTMPGLHKNHMIFNGDRAKTYKFGIVAEGFFDVARIGKAGGGLFGKTVSHWQRQLIHAYWSRGGAAFMLDADALAYLDKALKLFTPGAFKQGLFGVIPPGDMDPGEMTTEGIWELVAAYAANRGIKLELN